MNFGMYYTWLLMDIFIEALMKDNDSIIKNYTKLEATEYILENNKTWSIDEDDVIWETVDGISTEIFQNEKKNQDAIDALKILLSYEEN